MEEDNVIKFPGVTEIEYIESDFMGDKLDIEPVLRGIQEQDLEDILVIGRNFDGDIYFATTSNIPSDILWDLERAKMILMSSYFQE